MSGHSKWATIKHKKGATDAKRGKLFTKLSRRSSSPRKEGGADPAANISLQNAIEKAKSYSMPKDTIERAIARGAGTDRGCGVRDVVYEGYGPDGAAVLVEALTDNRNRTASDVRHLFTKNGGNLGTTGAVAWLFERRGIVLVDAAGVGRGRADTRSGRRWGGGRRARRLRVRGRSAPEDLAAVREAIEAAGIKVESAELSMVPKTTVEVVEEPFAKKLIRLIEALEENDDVSGRLRELRHLGAGARSGLRLGGSGEISAESPGRAGRPDAASSVAPIATTIGAPCVLASERPAHPGNERHSARPSLPSNPSF